MRCTPGAKEFEELIFKPKCGKKETASTSQGSPSVKDLTRLFQTPSPQRLISRVVGVSIQQGLVQAPTPPVVQQQPALAMAH